VRVSQSYDPGLRVELDGEPVDAVADSLGTGIVVAFPQGEHTITILGPSARLRNVLLALSGLIGTGLVVWLMVGRHRATPTTVA
jgi:hypothetical protein